MKKIWQWVIVFLVILLIFNYQKAEEERIDNLLNISQCGFDCASIYIFDCYADCFNGSCLDDCDFRYNFCKRQCNSTHNAWNITKLLNWK